MLHSAVRGSDEYGTKLPTYIIFKGKESGHVIHEFILKRMGYPKDQFYTIHVPLLIGLIVCGVHLQDSKLLTL